MRCSARVVLAFSAALLACVPNGGAEDDAGSDAGRAIARDAGVRDGGARDAGARDAGTPAHTDGWDPLEGVPSECEVAIAREPATVMPGWTVAPCVEDASGCREVVVDWTTTAPSRFRVIREGVHDGTSFLLVHQRGELIGGTRYYVDYVTDQTGRALVAMRYRRPADTRCSHSYPLVRGPQIVLATMSASEAGSIERAVLMIADPRRFRSTLRLVGELDDELRGVATPYYAFTDAETVVIQTGPPPHHAYRASGAAMLERLAGDGTNLIIGGVVDGETYLVLDGLGARPVPARVAVGSTTPEPFEASAMSEPAMLRATPGWVSWVRLYPPSGSSAATAELWASPLTGPGAALAPRLVDADFPVAHRTSLAWQGHGRFAVLDDDGRTLWIYDLESGEKRFYRVPERFPRGATTPVTVNHAVLGPEEVAIAIVRPRDGYDLENATILFVRYDGLPLVAAR